MKDEQKTKKQLIAELEELRRHVAELEKSENQHVQEGELLRIFRSTPIGLFIVQDGKFQFVNDVFRNITGGQPDELIGTESRNLVLPEDREMVRENAVKMLNGERMEPYK